MTTYIDNARQAIEEVFKQTKHHELPRQERIELLRKITEEYALMHSIFYELERQLAINDSREVPYRPLDDRLLEKAANLVLYEELTDKSQNKVREMEYPFLSDMQMARRTEGAHERNTGVQKGEAPFTNAETIATNGRNYAVPKRRKRSIHEDLLRDEQAMIRNKERRRIYNEFTAIQPVITYKMSEFVS